jgi:hypothetical protein
MSWAKQYIRQLQEGKMVSFRPKGNSMQPKIESGQLCTCDPISDWDEVKVGSVVLCKVKGNEYLHLVVGIKTILNGKRLFLIGNNKGRINGWVGNNNIYGILRAVDGKIV